MIGKRGFFGAGLILVALAACHPGKKEAPDVSGISISVHIHRFDRDFMGIDTNRVGAGLSGLYREYPGFLGVYLEHIMNFGAYPDTGGRIAGEVRAYLTGRDIRLLQDTVNAHFPELTGIRAGLRQGFRYLKYYFPGFRPPRVVTFVSGLANYGAVTVDSVLGIGLDMFLGPGFVPYTKVADPYPTYMLHQFSPEYIIPDCFKVLQQQLYPPPQGGTLLDQMIAYGKQLYFLDRILPGVPDSLKIGYTGTQLAWCRDNEQYIWQYLVQNDLLYLHEQQQIMHYIGPGPSTQGMPPAAPGNIGSWIGWQIVRRYMGKKPGTTLRALMEDNHAQRLLATSGYSPH